MNVLIAKDRDSYLYDVCVTKLTLDWVNFVGYLAALTVFYYNKRDIELSYLTKALFCIPIFSFGTVAAVQTYSNLQYKASTGQEDQFNCLSTTLTFRTIIFLCYLSLLLVVNVFLLKNLQIVIQFWVSAQNQSKMKRYFKPFMWTYLALLVVLESICSWLQFERLRKRDQTNTGHIVYVLLEFCLFLLQLTLSVACFVSSNLISKSFPQDTHTTSESYFVAPDYQISPSFAGDDVSITVTQDEDIIFETKDLYRMQRLYKIMGVIFLIFNLWFDFLGPIIGISLLPSFKDSNLEGYWIINLGLTRAIMQETLMLMMILVLIFVFQVSHKASASQMVQKQSPPPKPSLPTVTPAFPREKSVDTSQTPPSDEIFGSSNYITSLEREQFLKQQVPISDEQLFILGDQHHDQPNEPQKSMKEYEPKNPVHIINTVDFQGITFSQPSSLTPKFENMLAQAFLSRRQHRLKSYEEDEGQ